MGSAEVRPVVRCAVAFGFLILLAVGASGDSAWSIRFLPRPMRHVPQWPARLFSRAAYGVILAHLRGRSVADLAGIIDLPDRIFPGAEFRQSPNCDLRSNPAAVDCVVVHATVIDSEETVSKFLDPTAKVSAHFVVHKDGSITQMVAESMRAWHAGVSELEGVAGVNDFSIGIEIVNRNDGIDPFTDAQYGTVAAIIRFMRDRYAIPDSRIVSHEFVARPHGRKNDPVGFDFARLKRLVN